MLHHTCILVIFVSECFGRVHLENSQNWCWRHFVRPLECFKKRFGWLPCCACPYFISQIALSRLAVASLWGSLSCSEWRCKAETACLNSIPFSSVYRAVKCCRDSCQQNSLQQVVNRSACTIWVNLAGANAWHCWLLMPMWNEHLAKLFGRA